MASLNHITSAGYGGGASGVVVSEDSPFSPKTFISPTDFFFSNSCSKLPPETVICNFSDTIETVDAFIGRLREEHASVRFPVRALNIPANLRKEITDEHLAQIVETFGESIELLNLSGCTKITNMGVAHLPRVSKLKVLNLSGTKITGDSFVSLSNLSTLESLDVSHLDNRTSRRGAPSERVRDEHLVPLRRLSNLSHLNLNGSVSSLTDLGLTHLPKNLTHLSVAGINRNFTGEGLNKLITELNKLTYLNLMGWKLLKDENMPLFAKAKNLTNLVLGSNKLLTYNALRPLHLIPNLTDLALLYFEKVLTREPLTMTARPIPLVMEYLSRCPKLKRLNVYESLSRSEPVSEACTGRLGFDELQAANLRNLRAHPIEVFKKHII